MRLELEVRTIDGDIPLGAEVMTDDIDHDLSVILDAIKSSLSGKDWTSVVAKVYF